MEASVESFRERLSQPWLVGVSPESARKAFEDAVDSLRNKAGSVVVGLRNDEAFVFHVLAAMALGRPCILATESWPAEMLKSIEVPVDTVLGDVPWLSYVESTDTELKPGTLLIATGGSGGRLRFAMHSWQTLSAAVEGYRRFWQADRLDVVNVLPVYHVGGFVPVMRSFITGGQCALANWKEVEGGSLPSLPSELTHISIVPTQLKRLVATDSSCDWLGRFEAVLIGGGSAPQGVLGEALENGVRVVPAYGMTEGLGTIALARDFYSSMSTTGEVLPHWRVRIVDGEIELAGDALFEGYFPGDPRQSEWHGTNDLGVLDGRRLTVLGRKDHLIISGGEKVNPVVVEEAMRATGLCRDVAVLGVEDDEWGQRVVALIEGESTIESLLREALRTKLPPYALPKSYRFVVKLPRNEMGKLDRTALLNLL